MNKKALVSFLTITSILLSSVSPAMAKSFNSRTNISLNHPWTVSFNKKINLNEAFEGVYIKESNSNKLPTKITFDDSHTKMIITPTDGYKPNTTYTLTVAGICDEDGKVLSDGATMNFTTANEAQKGRFDINTVYANGSVHNVSSNVEPNSFFSLQLSKNIDSSTLSNITVTDMDGNKANVTVTAMGSELDIAPNNVFWDDTHTIDVPKNGYKCNKVYSINLSGVKSVDGQDLGTKTYKFTTRNYNFNPTIQGICNDDYISFGDQYAGDLWAVPNSAGGSLQKCHDNNGILVLDSTDSSVNLDQISSNWNQYANKQSRNIVDLQVELRKQQKSIAAKNSSYAGYNVGFLENSPQSGQYVSGKYFDTKGQVQYNYTPSLNAPISDGGFKLYSYYKEGCPNVFTRTGNLGVVFDSIHPQAALTINNTNNSKQDNLTRLALYQSLYCMFGGDIANVVYDYVLYEKNSNVCFYGSLQTRTVGPVTIYSQDHSFLFKY